MIPYYELRIGNKVYWNPHFSHSNVAQQIQVEIAAFWRSMNRKIKCLYLLTFLLFAIDISFGQNQVSGVVINGNDNSKLAAASVFINNSSKGTMTGNDGSFTISGITETFFELVISYAGFETVSLKINHENIQSFHTIKLFPRKFELEEVSLESPVKDGWEKWGDLFTNYFIGRSKFASECKLENPEVLRFFFNKKTHVIRAFSLGNLIIDNRALGYKVKYQLEQFTYDPNTHITSYFGYTNFEDLNKNGRRKWELNRKLAYKGSFMHFVRALYLGKTAEEGFEVKEKIRIYNTDSVFGKIYRDGKMAQTVMNDSNRYSTVGISYDQKTPEYIDLYNVKPYPLNKAISIDPVTKEKTFYFTNHLLVSYNSSTKTNKSFTDVVSLALSQTLRSDIYLIIDHPIIIFSNGLYFNPSNVLTEGYWASCKMADTLPADYIDK